MIYLSQLILNPHSRMVQKEVHDPYQLHRTVMRGFNVPREKASVLHRLDVWPHVGLMVLVQSAVEPNWEPLLSVGQGRYLQAAVDRPKKIDFTLPQGGAYRFRLLANPTIKKRRDGKKHSNRIPLVHEKDQIDWLCKKSTLHGFHLRQFDISDNERLTDWIHRDQSMTHKVTIQTVRYEGVLQVTDADKFNAAWRSGIGPAKAFGCGLLSLAPV